MLKYIYKICSVTNFIKGYKIVNRVIRNRKVPILRLYSCTL